MRTGKDLWRGQFPPQTLILRSEGGNCLVYFEGDGTRFNRFLPAGITTVFAGPGAPLLPALKNVLTALGIVARGPVIEFFRTSDRHFVTVPGLYLSSFEGRRFITDTSAGEHLLNYLERSGIEVLVLNLTSE